MMDNQYVKEWWENQHKNQYFKKLSFGFSYKNMDKFNLKGKTILEIGGGYGRETSQFIEMSDKVYGVDISKSAIKFMMKTLSDEGFNLNPDNFKEYNGIDLPFDDKMFDFIYSCFVIQHMSKNNAEKLLKDCLRVLKDDGKIFFEFFGHPDFIRLNEDSISGSKDGEMYNNAYVTGEIYNLISKVNAVIDFIEPWSVQEDNGKGELIKFNNYWVCIKKGDTK